jgi:hypothetical protein
MQTQTKELAPWNIKPSRHRLILETMPRDVAQGGCPRAFSVRSVTKYRSRFTGANVWRIYFNDETSSLGYGVAIFHGVRRSGSPRIPDWKAEKALVEIIKPTA